ncbi:MAG TPA: 4Fe-4S dicluster domain-containing protein [Clostridia bacterium]|jgi:carbon-monoxide dehydrogenase iron sulfur subunit|nr:4Fe-4S dicluster domain-containing protein [Clostridia bacterium]
MEKSLVIKPEKCTGCRTCELICSFKHTQETNPMRSRISVFCFEKVGFSTPIVCQQCSKPACMEICPVNAISKSEETGAMIVDDIKCIKCKMCTVACPFGATIYDPVLDVVAKCDLCYGDPQCVKYCPSKAITYQAADEAHILRRKSFAEKFRGFYEEVNK